MSFIKQVESAFEFARICQKLDFHNFVFSMKASNPVVMVQAYRLLVAEMYVQGWDYPLHLGVTEAGEGEDGRMKSAIGIGTLLQVLLQLLLHIQQKWSILDFYGIWINPAAFKLLIYHVVSYFKLGFI